MLLLGLDFTDFTLMDLFIQLLSILMSKSTCKFTETLGRTSLSFLINSQFFELLTNKLALTTRVKDN